ncbi:hypothetical protein [Aureimonas psammosilenae]|uniref:hypothetical protein n=1 Tax=Aureimonas psammosilenae TaxID=2495496 RepID=UPI001F40C69C|nr:hypothetical protein [Aureimonas psammosilenae]
MAAGFIISPDAVRERSEYQEAPPQAVFTLAVCVAVCADAICGIEIVEMAMAMAVRAAVFKPLGPYPVDFPRVAELQKT